MKKDKLFDSGHVGLVLDDDKLYDLYKDVCRYVLGRNKCPQNFLRYLEDSWAPNCKEVSVHPGLHKIMATLFKAQDIRACGWKEIHCLLLKDQPLAFFPGEFGTNPFKLSVGDVPILLNEQSVTDLRGKCVTCAGHGALATEGTFMKMMRAMSCKGAFALR